MPTTQRWRRKKLLRSSRGSTAGDARCRDCEFSQAHRGATANGRQALIESLMAPRKAG
jgi:hypothetical protein